MLSELSTYHTYKPDPQVKDKVRSTDVARSCWRRPTLGYASPAEGRREVVVERGNSCRHAMQRLICLQLLLPVKSAVFFEWAIQNVSCLYMAFMRFPVVM